ncbi:MAG: hypothetical protein GF398_15995 [Chitinivibrionales bacterium]|nr:hypothetical protein [Chitinivibrionales bacterium]
MRSRLVCSALLSTLFIFSFIAAAEDITAIYYYQSQEKNTGNDGIWMVQNPDVVKQISGTNDGNTNIRSISFSQNGKKIAFLRMNGMLCTMNNNGKNIVEHVNIGNPTQVTWVKTGIFWQKGKDIIRYVPEADLLDTVANIPSGGSHRLFISNDGLKAWVRVAQPKDGCDAHPKCTYRDEDLNAKLAGGASGGYPYFDFEPDYSDYTIRLRSGHGHGACITGDGQHVVLNTGFYLPDGVSSNNVPKVGGGTVRQGHQSYLFVDHDTYDMLIHVPLRKPGMQGFGGGRAVANQDDWLLLESAEGELYNYKTYDTLHLVDKPEKSKIGGAWLGPLPSPSDSPELSVAPSEVIMSAQGSSGTISKNAIVINVGSGDLTKVTAQVKTGSASWLSITVEGSGGNSQTIKNEVTIADLPHNSNTATVEIFGGGASNSLEYTVTVTTGSAIAAPSELKGQEGGTDKQDVTLTWNDNSNNEDGFVIERAPSFGSFEEIARVNAGATTYKDENVALGDYSYRVAAYNGSSMSGYSNELVFSVTGVPFVNVTSPAAGDEVIPGSTVQIKWTANLIDNVLIEYTIDDGTNWEEITKTGGILFGDSDWGNYSWNVPLNLTAPSIIVSVREYGKSEAGFTPKLDINPSGTRAALLDIAGMHGLHIRQKTGQLQIHTPFTSQYELKLFGPRGKLLHHVTVDGGAHSISRPGVAGIYYLQIVHGGKRMMRRITSND